MSDLSNIALNVLNSAGFGVIVLDAKNKIKYMNSACEGMLWVGFYKSKESDLLSVIQSEALLQIVEYARANKRRVLERKVKIKTPRTNESFVNIEANPMHGCNNEEGWVSIYLSENAFTRRISGIHKQQNLISSASAMASILAHEIRNPLSGVRGAAQLLEQTVSENDKALTSLIRSEVDRIAALIDKVSTFSDTRKPNCDYYNIHSILAHVKEVAEKGFGSHVKFIEEYDPSLPEVYCNKNQMIQVFMNLVKNASEAVAENTGVIKLKTSYRHGEKVVEEESGSRTYLPFVITVEDNGTGVSDNVIKHLFDPFVSGKDSGSGLGLAIVAKIVHDHNGVVDFSSEEGKTIFEIFLPIKKTETEEESNNND